MLSFSTETRRRRRPPTPTTTPTPTPGATRRRRRYRRRNRNPDPPWRALPRIARTPGRGKGSIRICRRGGRSVACRSTPSLVEVEGRGGGEEIRYRRVP